MYQYRKYRHVYYCPYLKCFVPINTEPIETREDQCNSWCPECSRRCTLVSGHYGDHKCSQWHRW